MMPPPSYAELFSSGKDTRQLSHQYEIFSDTQAALMLDSGRSNRHAKTDKIQHLLQLCDEIYRCIYGENDS